MRLSKSLKGFFRAAASSRHCPRVDKVRYPTEDAARDMAKRYRKYHGTRMDAYRCRHCHDWHIGHPPKR